jgi:hypothetical protein
MAFLAGNLKPTRRIAAARMGVKAKRARIDDGIFSYFWLKKVRIPLVVYYTLKKHL